MPNYGYHLARAQGRLVESVYHAALPLIASREINCARHIPMDVFSYSGETRLAEQVASIRSFLRNAGRPNRFVVVSDGTHSTRSIKLLQSIDRCVSVEEVPPPADGSESLTQYLRFHPTGKQLALLMSLPHQQPALYVDSDVRFFAAAPDVEKYATMETSPAHYLQDCGLASDERLLHDPEKKSTPVNIGVLMFRRSLDWSLSISRFLELKGEPNFFTGQTMTHLTMHANQAEAFDRAKYVVQLDDQFVYPDRYAGSDVALRHYVNPVRHKFWTSLIR